MTETRIPDDSLPEGWEAWLAYLAAALPDPVEQTTLPDGSILFRAGEPGEVIVHLLPRSVTVSLFTVQRVGLDHPLVVARPIGRVMWRRIPVDQGIAAVEALVTAARAARHATFLTCEVCDQSKPPETMADETTCRSCARRDTVH